MGSNLDRRAVLLGTVASVAGLAGVVRPARALSFEEVPDKGAMGLALSNRCGGSQEHAALVALLDAELAAEPADGPRSITASCPICGCPVTVSRATPDADSSSKSGAPDR